MQKLFVTLVSFCVLSSTAFAGGSGSVFMVPQEGFGGLDKVKELLPQSGGGVVFAEAGGGGSVFKTTPDADLLRELSERSGVSQEDIIHDSASLVSTFRTGDEFNYEIDWENSKVDFFDAQGSFNEVVEAASALYFEATVAE